MRLALLIAVAGLAASSSGAVATRTAPLPPIVFTSNRSDHDLVVFQANGKRRHTITASARDDTVLSRYAALGVERSFQRELAFVYLQTTAGGPPARLDVPLWVVLSAHGCSSSSSMPRTSTIS